MKNSLSNKGYLNYHAYLGTWNGSAVRDWCNSGFRQAIESIYGSGIFKQFNCITGIRNSNTNSTTQDYFAFPAEREVYPNGWNSTASERGAVTLFTYYETTANRLKYVGSEVSRWWLRSPCYNYSQYFLVIGAGGSSEMEDVTRDSGISPFGCV